MFLKAQISLGVLLLVLPELCECGWTVSRLIDLDDFSSLTLPDDLLTFWVRDGLSRESSDYLGPRSLLSTLRG